jgi:hypothetical protein
VVYALWNLEFGSLGSQVGGYPSPKWHNELSARFFKADTLGVTVVPRCKRCWVVPSVADETRRKKANGCAVDDGTISGEVLQLRQDASSGNLTTKMEALGCDGEAEGLEKGNASSFSRQLQTASIRDARREWIARLSMVWVQVTWTPRTTEEWVMTVSLEG